MPESYTTLHPPCVNMRSLYRSSTVVWYVWWSSTTELNGSFGLAWKRGPCDASDVSQVNTTVLNRYYALCYEHAERVTQQQIYVLYRRMPEHRFETWLPGDFVVAGHLTMPASAASVSCMDRWSLWHSSDMHMWISSISEANHSCALCGIAVWYGQSRKKMGCLESCLFGATIVGIGYIIVNVCDCLVCIAFT